MANDTTLILGGARSGKSRRAQGLAEALGPRRSIVATAVAFDSEMSERIARHRADRDASWRTVEASHDLSTGLREACEHADVVLIDCLTLWLSNLLFARQDVPPAATALLADLQTCPIPVVLVSNEVGSGLVPDTPLGRQFRDEQGRLNQQLADVAGRVELVVAGQTLVIKAESD